MSILPQPRNVVRSIETPNVITLCFNNPTWKAPPTFTTTQIIKQAVIYLEEVYAITDAGKLLSPNGAAIILESVKQETVIHMGVIGTQMLVLVLENRALFYNGQLEATFSSSVFGLVTGYSHAYLQTKDGYKFYGDNVRLIFNLLIISHMANVETAQAKKLSNLQI